MNLNTITETETRESSLTDDFFQRLPVILNEGCHVLTDPIERQVFLIGALGLLSGTMPNVCGLYDGSIVYPNLYFFLLGRYGQGKGSLKFSKALGYDVHEAKKSKTPQEILFIPANNSKTGILELLSNNGGAGILFESEADTLETALTTDYGRFSDTLRGAYHHEPISYYRRGNKEFIEITRPALSVVVSGTWDQLTRLIPTPENGLFSRFLFYQLTENKEFKNVFDPGKNDYSQAFAYHSGLVLDLYKFLESAKEPYFFQFAENQKQRFHNFFSEMKATTTADISGGLAGVVHRLGISFFRIAMQLTVLRHISGGGLRRPLICNDTDFELSEILISEFKNAAIDIFLRMPQEKQQPENELLEKAKYVTQALELRANGLSFSEIAMRIFGTETAKSKIYRWITGK